jgi:hypothetical protein
MNADITGAEAVVPAEGLHVIALDGEKVVFSPSTASLHHLDHTAALVWDCLSPSSPVADICADLADVFGADPTAVSRDVTALLARLVQDGVAEVAQDVAEVMSIT